MGGIVCLFRRVKGSDERRVKKTEESRKTERNDGFRGGTAAGVGRMKERGEREGLARIARWSAPRGPRMRCDYDAQATRASDTSKGDEFGRYNSATCPGQGHGTLGILTRDSSFMIAKIATRSSLSRAPLRWLSTHEYMEYRSAPSMKGAGERGAQRPRVRPS